jgi:acetyl esterase/lipase
MKTNWFICLTAALFPVLLQAQESSRFAEKTAIQYSRNWLDVDYVGDGHIGHRLDIHLPLMEQEEYTVVICIYGSAFFSNNAKGAAFKDGIGQVLLESGFAVVTINHRASTDAIFPAQIQDVKAAIRYVRANAPSYSLDPSFIGITGWSSGGHLSSLAGTTNHVRTHEINGISVDIEGSLGNNTKTSSHVDAVVDWFGPTDFLIMDSCGSSMSHDVERSPESSLIGGAIQTLKDKCRLADPATYASKDSPPFLIFHGDEDPLVPHCQSEHLHEKLLQAGAKSELHIIKGGKHGPGVMTPENYAKMVSFLTSQNLKSLK